MSFVHDPNQLRETVQHQVEAVVHQADGLLHSPRKTTRYSQRCTISCLHMSLQVVQLSCASVLHQGADGWVICWHSSEKLAGLMCELLLRCKSLICVPERLLSLCRDVQMTSVKSGTLDSSSSNNLRHRETSSQQSNLDASAPHADTNTLSDSFKSK